MPRTITDTIELTCPREDVDGDACAHEVVAHLEYEPPDPNYGADADGNRGIRVPGYWRVSEVAGRCAVGHELTAEELAVLELEADQRARDYSPRYDG